MKAPFKTILITALATISAFVSVTYVSCNRDKCKTIVCGNGGVCNNGSCVCPSGYEGSNCETVSRDKFLGNWNVLEKGTVTNSAQYTLAISKTSDITQVVITNFYNYFRTPIKAFIKNDTITIPNQQYEGKVLFGIGYISSPVTYGQFGSITMRYEIIDTATNVVNDFGVYPVDASDPSAWNK